MTAAVRQQLPTIDPETGIAWSGLGPRPRTIMLEHNLIYLLAGEDGDRLMLTTLGADIRNLLVEIDALEAQAKRMREMDGVIGRRDRQRTDPADLPALPHAISARAHGNLNHDSFAAFIASLNEAGLNRWQEPHFMGQPEREDGKA